MIDPAFIDYADQVDYGSSDFYVHPGVEYDKQILISSAVLARHIHDYLPADDSDRITWNPWCPEGFMTALEMFLDAFSTHCFPVYEWFDGLNDAIERLYWAYPLAHGFNNYETAYEQWPDHSLMYYMTLQADVESFYSAPVAYGHGEMLEIMKARQLPAFNLHRLIGKIVWLIQVEAGVSAFSISEARDSLEFDDLDRNGRLSQFLFLLRWLSNSTGIELMDIDPESNMTMDDPLDMVSPGVIRYFIGEWLRGKVYYDVLRVLNVWTADDDNLEFLLEFVRKAGKVTRVIDNPDLDQLAAEIAELFVSLSYVLDGRVVNAPLSFWSQMATAGDEVIERAKQLVRGSFDVDDRYME